jgi:LysM repeat protein
MARRLRFLFLLILVAGLFAAVYYYITQNNRIRVEQIVAERSTLAVQTAIAGKIFELTRTAEAPLPHYRLILVEEGKPLIEVAEEYNTTIEVLRMANNLLPIVDAGDGSQIIIPEGIQNLEPPRRFTSYTVLDGDTLELLAVRFGVDIEQLKIDNPILATRNLLPGDVVFIPELLR